MNLSNIPIKKLDIQNKDYPSSLKKISDPPEILYIKGKLPNKGRVYFAIVGTRKYSLYGKQITQEIARDLIEAGLVIVSGLAPGIDAFAHLAAVKLKKPTVAVLGTGLDLESVYPKSNLWLMEEILKTGGCLISEYPPGTHGSKFTFPKRNRIIAGLSSGVLVIEAKRKSGSLITAQYAFSQNKKVFAVPGSIYSVNSKGCHFLIKKGANLVESAQDILQELNISQKLSPKEMPTYKTKEQKAILEILSVQSMHIDQIVKKTGFSVSLVNKTLAILELEGKVKNLGGNTYALGNR